MIVSHFDRLYLEQCVSPSCQLHEFRDIGLLLEAMLPAAVSFKRFVSLIDVDAVLSSEGRETKLNQARL